MKKLLVCLLLVTPFTLSSLAQEKRVCPKASDAVNAQKVEFFNSRLNLTSPEQNIFWPIYNEYWDKKMKIVCERKETIRRCTQDIDKLTDSEIDALSSKHINYQLLEYELMKEYHEKFLKVLPPRKALLVYMVDNEFKSYLLWGMKKSGKE